MLSIMRIIKIVLLLVGFIFFGILMFFFVFIKTPVVESPFNSDNLSEVRNMISDPSFGDSNLKVKLASERLLGTDIYEIQRCSKGTVIVSESFGTAMNEIRYLLVLSPNKKNELVKSEYYNREVVEKINDSSMVLLDLIGYLYN